VASAIGAKQLGPVSPMAALNAAPVAATPTAPEATILATPAIEAPAMVTTSLTGGAQPDQGIRWFNGRPVRPARVITMKVTAYSADAASCYPFADGQTATLHGIDTNGGYLVAADTDLLPFGTMLTIDGYANNQVVPVLDRGGAIKGNRLDLLFPSHEAALKWGVKTLDVVIWEYADGKPAIDPREQRS
ncbi:MAG: 3D domain-containing protein, partial [Phycisphaerales bacterium JB064]